MVCYAAIFSQNIIHCVHCLCPQEVLKFHENWVVLFVCLFLSILFFAASIAPKCFEHLINMLNEVHKSVNECKLVMASGAKCIIRIWNRKYAQRDFQELINLHN